MLSHAIESPSMSIISPSNSLCLAANGGWMMENFLNTHSSHIPFERCEALYSGNSPHSQEQQNDKDGNDMKYDPCGENDISRTNSFTYTPSFDKCDVFSTTFEDPFQYQSSAEFSTPVEEKKCKIKHESDSRTLEIDKKLLGFCGPILNAAIFDETGQVWPIMSAELNGMFFLTEDTVGENNARGDELTCYRRNLFQITGAMILSRGINGIINEHGQFIPIYNLEATLTAFESIEGKKVDIISVPWKITNCTSSEEKAGTAPSSFPIDLNMNLEQDPSVVSFPVSWKRLQFKHATANNGRRKGLQQHYVVQVNLVATLANGEIFRLAEIQSGPIIVRGRSPRNFDSRSREIDKKMDVKANQPAEPTTPTHRTVHDPGPRLCSLTDYSDHLQYCSDTPEQKNNHEQSPVDSHPIKKQRLSNSSIVSSFSNSSFKFDEKFRHGLPKSTNKIPLVDEELNNVRLSVSSSPRTKISQRDFGIESHSDNFDIFYEYFPLSLDDWIPPVDAIYRPHAVHHTRIPENVRAEQNMRKRKIYFSAND
ncbi:hypothetical protein Golomagni_03899 [Golovinomyces magnicellulatus]|nr:hypothetical protein Golomagni_03899 [Golovinomyces magnicellulatus]